MLRQYEAEDLDRIVEQLTQQEQRRHRFLTVSSFLLVAFVWLAETWQKAYLRPYSGPCIWACLFLWQVILRSKWRTRRYAQVLHPLTRPDTPANLGTLLRLHSICLANTTAEETQLRSLCESRLKHQLSRATVGELEQLTTSERRLLANLLYRQNATSPLMTPVFQGISEPDQSERQLLIVLLLTLATLKQPGGERTAKRILKHFKNEALREAAQDYLKAIA